MLQVVALQVCEHPDIVTCVAFHPHSARTFATGCADGRVRVWSAAEGAVVASASIQGDMVTALAWSQDGTTLIAGTLHGRCRYVWSSPGFYLSQGGETQQS
jgi:WD40 repeat protein